MKRQFANRAFEVSSIVLSSSSSLSSSFAGVDTVLQDVEMKEEVVNEFCRNDLKRLKPTKEPTNLLLPSAKKKNQSTLKPKSDL